MSLDPSFFYIISFVKPSNKFTGGDIVLYRHFIERPGLQFKLLDVPIVKNSFFKRLEKTRFGSYIKSLQPFYETAATELFKSIPKPAFVFTVAHDRECFAALKAAQYWNVPLVTVFHDWYPASSGAHHKLLYFLNQEFKALYKASSLALCVSKQMKEALGSHPNSIVLPPIPSTAVFKQNQLPHFGQKISLLYSGFCGGAYQQMVQDFINRASQKSLDLVVSGPHSQELTATAHHIHIAGFLGADEFASVFENAAILLVFLNFNPDKKLHFSTHFPSKLVEYVGKGKMIGIWGPSYSTAVEWAKETGAAFYYENNDADGFIQGLFSAYNNDAVREGYLQHAALVYEKEFSPEVIDALLKSKLAEVADH